MCAEKGHYLDIVPLLTGLFKLFPFFNFPPLIVYFQMSSHFWSQNGFCDSWTYLLTLNLVQAIACLCPQKSKQNSHCLCSDAQCVLLFVIPQTVAHQAPLFMGISWQEYWSGLPFPIPGDLPNPRIEPILLHLLHLQVDSLYCLLPEKPKIHVGSH